MRLLDCFPVRMETGRRKRPHSRVDAGGQVYAFRAEQDLFSVDQKHLVEQV